MNFRIKVLLSCIAALITIVPATYMGYQAVSDSNTAVNSVSLEFEKYTAKSARNYVENALRICQMAEFWDYDSSTTSRTVDVYMAKLREKTSHCNGFEIATVHGLGYKVVLK